MIDLTIFYDNGNLNKNKLRENWVYNNYRSLYNELINFRNNSNLSDIKFSNLIIYTIPIKIPSLNVHGVTKIIKDS